MPGWAWADWLEEGGEDTAHLREWVAWGVAAFGGNVHWAGGECADGSVYGYDKGTEWHDHQHGLAMEMIRRSDYGDALSLGQGWGEGCPNGDGFDCRTGDGNLYFWPENEA